MGAHHQASAMCSCPQTPSKTAGCEHTEHQAHGGATRIDTPAAARTTTQELVGVSRPSGNLGFFCLRWDFWVALVTTRSPVTLGAVWRTVNVGCQERNTKQNTNPRKKKTQLMFTTPVKPELALLSLLKSVGQKKPGHVIGKLHFCGSRYHGQTVRRGSGTRTKQWRASGTHSTMTAVMPE